MNVTKTIDVCGMGNGLVDVIFQISDREFEAIKLKKGGMTLADTSSQEELLGRLANLQSTMASGGSAGNTTLAISQLGGRTAFMTALGGDPYGQYYLSEFEKIGIIYGGGILPEEPTGTSIVLITEDTERTFQTCLGAAACLSPEHIDEAIIQQSRWLFIEGYLLSDPENAVNAVSRALELARKHDCRIALTFSDLFVVQNFRSLLEKVADQAELIFANESEACFFTGTDRVECALEYFEGQGKNAVITAGGAGAVVSYDGAKFRCPAFPCQPLDLNGAGDMYAGAFLFGITSGESVERAARGAAYLSMKVVTQIGPRLPSGGVLQYWNKALEHSF